MNLANIWAGVKWLARKILSPSKAFQDSHNEYKEYISLSSVFALLIVVNIVEVSRIGRISASHHPMILLFAPPAAILVVWSYIMGYWCFEKFKQHSSKWNHNVVAVKKDYREKFPARVGLVLGTLVAVLICQFGYLPFYALPKYRTVDWTLNYNKVGKLTAPMVLFTLYWSSAYSPELSTDVVCNTGGLLGTDRVGCAFTTIAPGRWSYGLLVNYSEPVLLGPLTAFVIVLGIHVEKPTNLQTNDLDGTVIPLHYQFIDPVFTKNVSAALVSEDVRYPVSLQYPWNSTSYVTATIEQVTVDDTVNSLGWSNHGMYPRYSFYNVNTEAETGNNAIPAYCGNLSDSCRMLLRLQISPQSLLEEVRHSSPSTTWVLTLIDEGAIVGGVSFLLFFLNMYMM